MKGFIELISAILTVAAVAVDIIAEVSDDDDDDD